MHSKVFRKRTLIFALFSFVTFSGCSATVSNSQKKFGPNADYFIGLQFLSQNKENEARSKFKKCIKKGSGYCQQKSAEALTTFGDVQEKNQAAQFLVENFPSSNSLLIAARQFSSAGENHKLIDITKNCDLTTEYNETIKLRLEAMQKRGDSNFDSEVFKWFTSRPISETHYKFYRDNLLETDFIIDYRIKVYRRDYTYALENAQPILDYIDTLATENDTKGTDPLATQLASDVGKAYLYASTNYSQNAYTFKLLAEKYDGTDLAYYFWFYSGRLYDKAQIYYSQTKKCFSAAVNNAANPDQLDNALWYLLDTSLNFSVESIIESIGQYSRQWNNPSYFDDFFENLITSLLASGKWDSFYEIYSQIDGYASDEIVAQFAYIYARLLQEGYAKPHDNLTKEECIQQALNRAINSRTASYYKILAAYHLNYDSKQLEELLCAAPLMKNQNLEEGTDPSAQLLLEGYASFGFPEKIYPAYMDLYKNGISTDTSIYLSDFLLKCAPQNHKYYTQSLRIAARAMNYGDRPLTKDELKLVFPKDFSEYVMNYSEKYSIDPSVMFALIRSESFFDKEVSSSAGAIGLCQLMEFTGADIAQRLRKSEYSLTDPECNIEFGTYYLQNLYSRTDNSYLQAFFSYNAGITRVRRWLQSSHIEFGKKQNMPGDLFLETVPFAETREYGRKLVSATVFYETIYNDNIFLQESFIKTVDKLLY